MRIEHNLRRSTLLDFPATRPHTRTYGPRRGAGALNQTPPPQRVAGPAGGLRARGLRTTDFDQ